MSHRYERGQQPVLKGKQHANTVFTFYAFKMRITEWRYALPKMQLKGLLAATLNNWVTRRCASIAAYLITDRSVYLLVAIRRSKPGKAIRELATSFIQELTSRQLGLAIANQPDYRYFYLTRMQDLRILKLLVTCPKTGIADAWLRRWQQKLRNANYSSVIDYLGGTGPVIVKRLPVKRRCNIIDRHVIA